MKEFEILHVKINCVNLISAMSQIEEWILKRKKTYVCVCPVSTIIECQKDAKYREIVNNSGMTTPDGMPVVWLGKLKGSKTIQRTYGPDLMRTLFSAGITKGFKHFLFGATEHSNKILIEKLKKKYPGIQIAGHYSPSLREKGEIENNQIIELINNSQSDILWIGLGSPKQDYWMYNHRNKLNVPVMIGVGAAFDFLSGEKKQAPLWMQRSGLEWLFRLACEPKRLWKRYLIGNTIFIWLLLKDSLKNLFRKT